MKNIHLDKIVIFACVSIFLEKTQQHHLVTKNILFDDVILVSDAALSSKGY